MWVTCKDNHDFTPEPRQGKKGCNCISATWEVNQASVKNGMSLVWHEKQMVSCSSSTRFKETLSFSFSLFLLLSPTRIWFKGEVYALCRTIWERHVNGKDGRKTRCLTQVILQTRQERKEEGEDRCKQEEREEKRRSRPGRRNRK